MIEALALYLAAGIFAGFVSALFGVGGGFTLVPTLIVGLTLQRMPADHLVHMTAGTALSVMVFTAGYAAWLRWRAGDFRPALVRRFLPFVAAGALAGATIGDAVSGDLIKAVFVGFLAVAIVRGLLTKRRPPSVTGDPPLTGVRGPRLWFWSSLAGLLGGLTGPGPPVLLTPYLRGLHFTMPTVAATTSPLTAAVGLFAGFGYVVGGLDETGLPAWSIGYLYLPAFAGLVAGAFLGAPAGIRLSHRIDDHLQGHLFTAYLCVVLAVMLAHTWLTAG
jgi:uncharacterized membrane protein YfcA